ncbi:MAG: DUF1134 domain-containing protein [Parvibaculaceae bacterium]
MRTLTFLMTALLLAAAPATAQVQTIDPNQADSYQPGEQQEQVPYQRDESEQAPAEQPLPESGIADPGQRSDANDYVPIESGPPATYAPQAGARDTFDARNIPVSQNATVPAGDVLAAAEGVFGRGARGLANILEGVLREQGEPVAYITGQEAGGAFMFGLRYGSGTMHHQIEGQRRVYWTGPSIGLDVGGNADKVFILVYNLHDAQRLFRRFPQAEGNVHFIGGFAAQYLRRGDVVLIPIRLGVGWRLGANAGYMRFSERSRWIPF